MDQHLPHSTQDFYKNLPRIAEFSRLAAPDAYMPLPDDWVVGVADIVGSTNEIAAGRYKVVNMVGAAVISAQLNAAELRPVPYIFAGDGAGFAVWPTQRVAAERALLAVQHWAEQEFSITLRVAMVTVADIRRAGQDVRVARHAPSEAVDFAMFSGGGLAWAETQMKAGNLRMLDTPDPVTAPDLTGLSCRWSNMDAQNGTILSLVMKPSAGVSPEAFAKVAQDVIRTTDGNDRGGHPVPDDGPGFGFPPPGLGIEAQAQHGTRPVWLKKLSLLALNLMIFVIFSARLRMGRFNSTDYRRSIGPNADFRKFDDGLKMTLDCDAQAQARIEVVLKEAAEQGLVNYGLHTQAQAMMTCLVPSATDAGHMHFVDGASGGYALAAAKLDQALPA
ncbi:DUF3095 domain-containing protein [Shimia sediminis]|uniref:DUF3095 domain-containing protein n=1 Tax=Shimia sediminis TaxID=2497945 RepID=UPI000F8D7DEB|nr:DUF3095 domain-containing protein [Shimia sediminis]